MERLISKQEMIDLAPKANQLLQWLRENTLTVEEGLIVMALTITFLESKTGVKAEVTLLPVTH